jgi:GNAT superfamily N-acetyltransferase
LPDRAGTGTLAGMVRIVEVDPYDDTMLRAYWEADQAAMRADRPDAVLRTFDALRNTAQLPNQPYYRRTLLAALDGDRVVGTSELGGSLADNTHLADLEVTVLPDHRRRGIGRALHGEAVRRARADGRTSICGEVHVAGAVADDDSAAYAFAVALGFEQVHVEHHLVLRLPVPADHLSALRASVADRAPGYEVVSWVNRCPDEYAAAYCEMKTQMSSDVPVGEVDYHPIVFDEARLRTEEERAARSHLQLVAAARRASDGTFGGYTVLFLPRGEAAAIQDDTLVMPEHRGHRLGAILKLATLDVVQRDHPERDAVHTWTYPANHAMYQTNLGFGFTVAERLYEMQRKED